MPVTHSKVLIEALPQACGRACRANEKRSLLIYKMPIEPLRTAAQRGLFYFLIFNPRPAFQALSKTVKATAKKIKIQ